MTIGPPAHSPFVMTRLRAFLLLLLTLFFVDLSGVPAAAQPAAIVPLPSVKPSSILPIQAQINQQINR